MHHPSPSPTRRQPQHVAFEAEDDARRPKSALQVDTRISPPESPRQESGPATEDHPSPHDSGYSPRSQTARRRSFMVQQARATQVKCNLPCFDEEDDGIPPCCRHEACPLDHRNRWLNLGSNDGGSADFCVKFGAFV